ncbi:SusC/RagA family TonB-linked outer membrane protein [Maribellus sediminis]|uniref:SusC/RagA family TonB-linked outer membrane protein n=1 Tax=Maribellus sediminis TaxID=2696285 RepID=UPI00143144DA|nr:TonB-dependent receptor [Maribellus sediminis]
MTNELRNCIYNASFKPIWVFMLLLFLAGAKFTNASSPVKENDVIVSQQDVRISGTITDESGEPLPGVTVLVKGTSTGVVSDYSGKYAIANVPANATLVVSYVGMVTQEIVVGNQTTIDVVMVTDAIGLEEVVAIGYGTVKKSDLTGAVGVIKTESLDQELNTNVANAIQGKLAGVTVENMGGAPGASMKIQIRGAGSLTNNDPLVLIDNFPGNLNNVNPSEIQSIQVLKDASAAAIYGTRAANGVILIETKSGSVGATKISVTADYGVQSLSKKMDVLTTDEWIKVNNAARAAAGQQPAAIALNPEVPGKGVDWQDEIYRNAPVQNYQVSMSGGKNDLKFNTSFGYLDQEGIAQSTGYQKMNLRMKSELKKGKFTFGESLILVKDFYDQAGSTGGGRGDALFEALLFIPAFNIYAPENVGGYNGPSGDVMNIGNPLAGLHLVESETENYRANLNTFARFEFTEHLNFETRVGASAHLHYTYNYKPVYDQEVANSNPINDLSESNQMNKFWQIENILSYNRSFGNHSINAILGQSSQSWKSRTVGGSIEELPEGIKVLSAGSLNPGSSGSEYQNNLISYFGRAVYAFQDRYSVTATFRRDGSSRFSPQNQWANFPSVAAAWNVGNESFFQDLNTPITELKIRASYGVLGNQNIGDYQYLGLISSGRNYVVGDPESLWIGNTQLNYPAVDIKWETTATSNIGLDVGFNSGKTNLTFDYFNKITSDLLLQVPIPLSTGVNSYPYGNAGEISNKGFELALNHSGTIGSEVKYSIGATLSHIKNNVESLATGSQQLAGGSAVHHDAAVTYTKQGYPMYSFFLIQTDGLFRSTADVQAHSKDGELIQPNAVPGDIRFIDANDDGKIDTEDRVYSGSPFPDIDYGLRLALDWRNFDFSAFLQGTQGNKIFNGIRAYQDAVRININYSKATLDSYTFNPDSDFPRLDLVDPNGNGESYSDRFLEDGSYLRLKDVQLGYTFTQNSFVNKLSPNANLRVYVGAQNLLTITNYSGYNPDIAGGGRAGSGLGARGIDYSVYPLNRSYHIGLQFNF